MTTKGLNAMHDTLVFQRRVRILARRLAVELHGGRSLLDVGSGDGSVACAIKAARPEFEVRGLDVKKRPRTKIPVDVFDGDTIPFADHSWDWITMVDVLHHTTDPQALLTEAARVCRLGVVIKDHLREGVAADATLRFMDWVGNRGHGVKLPYNYLSKAEWDRVLRGAGLTPKTWTTDLHLYPLPFSLVFDRGLHFIAALAPTERE